MAHKNLKKYQETVEERQAIQKARAIEYYKEMPVLKHAAAFAGVSQDTMTDWKKADPKFSEDLEMAKSEFIRRHGRKAKPEFLLERLDKDTFRESKEIEVTTPIPILDISKVVKDDTKEQ